ncbi:MAG: serine hydrolase, partial [Desulfosarcina sp.]|nr:serine hydrolase [Desulfobacterales bacterium]
MNRSVIGTTIAMPTNATPTRIQKAFREALDEGVFPGAVLLVQSGAVRRWHEAFGVADTISGEIVRKETVFDLASLTKPLCTSLAIMHQIQSGRLDLEDRLGDVVAAFSETDKADIRIRQLLSHQAGFPAWRPYFEILRQNPIENRSRVLAKLLAHEPLDFAPGTASQYSDLDFLALQMVVETVSGRRLDRYAAEKIYGPLGIGDLFFTDTAAPPPPRLFAATEKCPWRGRVLKGHVHDDNAYALGGVAGHAGLFGSAAGVADLLSAILSTYRHTVSPAVLATALFC